MSREYKQAYDGDTIYPEHSGYRMCCCDCGLTHIFDFSVVKKTFVKADGSYIPEPTDDPSLQVRFTASRSNRGTAGKRAWKRRNGWEGIR